MPQRRILRELVADDHQPQVVEPVGAHAREGVHQPLEVLVRLDVADIQHERVIELIALA